MRYQHWDELERAVERFVTADGPNTGDLPADGFFALWARFEKDRRRRVVVVRLSGFAKRLARKRGSQRAIRGIEERRRR